MRCHYVIGILLAALAFAGSAQLSAQDNEPGSETLILNPDGKTVYDSVNNVTWLADGNLPATERFHFPPCNGSPEEPALCIYASGAMNYPSATQWVADLNASDDGAGYLGHKDWQLPTAPMKDPDCTATGPNHTSFAFDCDTSALGYLYYTALGFKAPNTAIPIPPNEVGPFRNFQPNRYWSHSHGGGLPCNMANFDFASGNQGGGCGGDYLDVLPMIQGKIPGTPPASGMGLEVNPGGETVYDPRAEVTWLADANLAATETFGLPRCGGPTVLANCVARDGSMDYDTAVLFTSNMNAYHDGAGYLGQTNWELPPVNASCSSYNCHDKGNPMGVLYYLQLHFLAGEPVVNPPDIAVGPFHNLQPNPYWSCEADGIREACQTDQPAPGAEFGFSFGNGFQGTTRLPGDHFVTAYFPGCALPDQQECK